MNHLRCDFVLSFLFILVLTASVVESFSQKYLDSLSGTQTPPEPEGYEAIVPEEYYGLTNPMANSWAGSKHEHYGGYMHNLDPASRQGRPMVQPPANDMPK
jgi:hypothetical protein